MSILSIRPYLTLTRQHSSAANTEGHTAGCSAFAIRMKGPGTNHCRRLRGNSKLDQPHHLSRTPRAPRPLPRPPRGSKSLIGGARQLFGSPLNVDIVSSVMTSTRIISSTDSTAVAAPSSKYKNHGNKNKPPDRVYQLLTCTNSAHLINVVVVHPPE